jgi:hypothetical protein
MCLTGRSTNADSSTLYLSPHPRCWGIFEIRLPEQVRRHIIVKEAKNLTKSSENELAERLRELPEQVSQRLEQESCLLRETLLRKILPVSDMTGSSEGERDGYMRCLRQ